MITRVAVRAFRGIPDELSLTFGRLTLLSGRNGLGKTTIFDAVDWCLFGSASRFGQDSGPLVNLYRHGGTPTVEVGIRFGTDEVTLKRTPVAVYWDAEAIDDRELARRLVFDPDLVFQPFLRDPGARLRNFTYLPQDALRDIIAETHADVRAGLAAALAGIPFAGHISASVRKVRDRFSERESDLRHRIDAANDEATQIEARMQALETRVTEEEGALLQRVMAVLGLGTLPASPADALSIAHARLSQVLQGLRTREGLLAFIDSLAKERQSLEERVKQLALEQSDLAVLVENATKHLAAVRADAARLREADVADATARRVLEGQLAEARAAADTIRQLALLRHELRAGSAEVDAATNRVAVLQKASQEAGDALDRMRKEIADREVQLASLTKALQSSEEIATIERQLRDLSTSARASELELERLRSEVPDARAAWQRARESFQRALAELKRREERSAAALELRNHLARAAQLSQALGLRNCPLCRTDFRTPDDLHRQMQHALPHRADEAVEEGSDGPREAVATAQQQMKELEQAGVTRNVAIEQHERKLRGVRQDETLLKDRLARVPPLTPYSSKDEINRSILSIKDALTALLRQADELASEIDRRRPELARKATRRDQLARRMSDLQVRLTESDASLPKDATEMFLDASVQRLTADLGKLTAAAKLRHEQLAALASIEQAAQRDVAVRLSAATRTTSDAAEAADRISSLERDMRARLSDSGSEGAQGDISAQASRIAAEIQALEKTRDAIAREVPGLESLVRLKEQRDAAIRLAALRHEANSARARLAQLGRAMTRFGVVADALEQRRVEETRNATARAQTTIQQCLSTFTVQRHLNRVRVDEQGGVRVSDYALGTNHVAPDVYTSMGQQNVIALAIFVGFALRQPVSKLRTLLLDEPIQNLDDVNFLALLGLLKRLVHHRQVVLSTADRNVSEVVARQLRTWSADEFTHYVWEDFRPETGPDVRSAHYPRLGLTQANRGSA